MTDLTKLDDVTKNQIKAKLDGMCAIRESVDCVDNPVFIVSSGEVDLDTFDTMADAENFLKYAALNDLDWRLKVIRRTPVEQIL